jgi:hypothetical protein
MLETSSLTELATVKADVLRIKQPVLNAPKDLHR